MNEESIKRISLRLPTELHKELTVMANNSNSTTLHGFLIDLLSNYNDKIVRLDQLERTVMMQHNQIEELQNDREAWQRHWQALNKLAG